MQNPEAAVTSRYSAGAQAREATLCCPISFNPEHLRVLPEEIIERDYGCGDPTPFVEPGDVVLDLGSGAGKVCWIAAQITGPEGHVIGVDMNTDMLALARQYHDEIAGRVGFDNVTYKRGMIQDLALDFDLLEQRLRERPVTGAESWLELRQTEDQLRREQTMIPDNSVDVVLSNCVLNLVRPQDKDQLFEEIFRVVKPGGRVAISDIVADEDVPQAMQDDPTLWSGCISGSYREDLFLDAFAKVGFQGIEIVKRDEQPWQTVNGIEFRAMTVRSYKDTAGKVLERNQAVVYRGPFHEVTDDSGKKYPRGQRIAVSDKAFARLQRPPYEAMFAAVEPRIAIAPEAAEDYPCCRKAARSPRETKGEDYRQSGSGSSSCC